MPGRHALTRLAWMGGLLACTGGEPVPLPPVDPPGPQLFAGNAYYAGDPHAHTGFSGDGAAQGAECPDCGAFGAVFDHAKQAGLSWLALSDHVNGYPAATPEGFAAQQSAVEAANDPDGGFVTLPAAEVWFRDPVGDLGHKTLLLFGDATDLALSDIQPTADGGMDVGSCADIVTWTDALEARVGPLLLVPHHPAGHQPMPTDWTCHDPDREPLVEVYSEHGSALDDGFDPPWAGTAPAGTVPHALDPDGLALQMGFIAGTDGHDTLPGDVCGLDLVREDQPYGGGITMVVLPEDTLFGRDTLRDALVARRVYGTSGYALVMDVTWESGATFGLGEDVVLTDDTLTLTVRLPPSQAAAVLLVEVSGPAPFGRRVLTPAAEEATWTLALPADDVPAWLYVTIAADGDTLYPAGCDDGGEDTTELAWSSPSWFTRG